MGDWTVKGVGELVGALAAAGAGVAKGVKADLRAVGNIVRDDARGKFQPYSGKSAAGYRTYVRKRGVAVEQSLGRSTGRRGDFGALQMRKALVPALEENEVEAVDRFQQTVDHVLRVTRLS